jgi:hypothetical protein
MKNPPFFAFLICSISFQLYSQGIAPPSNGKSIVYFVRPTSLGFAINFSYFDGASFIGKFNGPKYMRYECDPGEHLFWARSENRDFIVAELDSGKVYFIEAVPQMGALKAQVQLIPIDPKNPKNIKKMVKIEKLIYKKPSESFTKDELTSETQKLQEPIEKSLEKYQESLSKGKKADRLEKGMFYEKYVITKSDTLK